MNGEPVRSWGKLGGILIEIKGIKLIEEINQQKNENVKKIREWIINNASWIVSTIPSLIEFLKK